MWLYAHNAINVKLPNFNLANSTFRLSPVRYRVPRIEKRRNRRKRESMKPLERRGGGERVKRREN
jgi:hypothetical protein